MKKATFCKIYWDMFGGFGLTPTEGLLLALIHGLSRNKGHCYASKQTLAEILNVSDICVYNNIARLVDKGLVERIGKVRGGVIALQVTDAVYSFIDEQNDAYNPH